MGVRYSVKYLRRASSTDVCPGGSTWTAQFSKASASASFTVYAGSALVKDGAPTPPSAADVLSCVLSDAQAECSAFPEWASDFGYPIDKVSRGVYDACLRNAKKLHRIFNPDELESLRDILQES